MLIPKFTIRQLMVIIAIFGGFSAILGFAARGSIVAHSAGIVILGLIVPLGVMAFIYWTLFAITKSLPGESLPIGPKKPHPNPKPEFKGGGEE